MSQKKQTYQIKITLQWSKPPIWRRVLIDSRYHLDDLHVIIQEAMGWDNSHLHQFYHKQSTYVQYNPEFGELWEGQEYEMGKPISLFLKEEKDKLMYEYDMGDGWVHIIELEKILPTDKKLSLPICTAGRRACPPEDIGGIGGYDYLQQVMADETHEDHANMLDWLGLDSGSDFDPATFSKDEVNERFAR
ncbi:hypothetical protein RCH20_002489 [Psychrobacter sp. PL15]|uniref:plasmid pRiA4b ORF-3 family protein n=1 Tax=Psychrobacter sp. PL15 TaxID=3071719 RepID=UPI002E093095|nr:hypothetical protein [Psychrobacter sp. PL15]